MDDLLLRLRTEHQDFVTWQKNFAAAQENQSNDFLNGLCHSFECLSKSAAETWLPSLQRQFERLQDDELQARHFRIERGSEKEWARRLKQLGVALERGGTLSLKQWDAFLFPRPIRSDGSDEGSQSDPSSPTSRASSQWTSSSEESEVDVSISSDPVWPTWEPEIIPRNLPTIPSTADYLIPPISDALLTPPQTPNSIRKQKLANSPSNTPLHGSNTLNSPTYLDRYISPIANDALEFSSDPADTRLREFRLQARICALQAYHNEALEEEIRLATTLVRDPPRNKADIQALVRTHIVKVESLKHSLEHKRKAIVMAERRKLEAAADSDSSSGTASTSGSGSPSSPTAPLEGPSDSDAARARQRERERAQVMAAKKANDDQARERDAQRREVASRAREELARKNPTDIGNGRAPPWTDDDEKQAQYRRREESIKRRAAEKELEEQREAFAAFERQHAQAGQAIQRTPSTAQIRHVDAPSRTTTPVGGARPSPLNPTAPMARAPSRSAMKTPAPVPAASNPSAEWQRRQEEHTKKQDELFRKERERLQQQKAQEQARRQATSSPVMIRSRSVAPPPITPAASGSPTAGYFPANGFHRPPNERRVSIEAPPAHGHSRRPSDAGKTNGRATPGPVSKGQQERWFPTSGRSSAPPTAEMINMLAGGRKLSQWPPSMSSGGPALPTTGHSNDSAMRSSRRHAPSASQSSTNTNAPKQRGFNVIDEDRELQEQLLAYQAKLPV